MTTKILWDEEVDVVVVGFGGAGACAAIQAAELGASVLAVDRYTGGGATARSGGVLYAAGTRFQKEAGVQDSPEEMYKYLSHHLKLTDDPTVKAYCAQSADNIDWLSSHGVPFGSTLFEEKADHPPAGYFLYYAGTEKRLDARKIAVPAPRGHRTVGEGMTGRWYFKALKAAAERVGVRFIANAPITRLFQDDNGTVIGVEMKVVSPALAKKREKLYRRIGILPFLTGMARRVTRAMREMEENQATIRRVRTRGGVIIAAGGFGHNLELLRKYAPAIAENSNTILRLGSLGCDGSGIELGVAAGGDIAKMDKVVIAQTMGNNLLRNGILVNRMGARFVPEDGYNGELGERILEQPGYKGWLVVNKSDYREAFRQIVKMPLGGPAFMMQISALVRVIMTTKRAKSLRSIAKKCGIDAEGLEQTVAKYNQDIDNGVVDSLGKDLMFQKKLVGPNFRAVNYSTGCKWSFPMMFTVGGLRVSTKTGEVVTADGGVIGGLYAAGRSAIGLSSFGYISGLSLGDGMFSGRRAAQHAVERAKAHMLDRAAAE